MTNTIITTHDKLKTFIELMKKDSNSSLPANIESKLEEIKHEVLKNGKNKFTVQSMIFFGAAENPYIKLTNPEKKRILKIIEENYESKFSKALEILQATRNDIENFKEFKSKDLYSLTSINTKTLISTLEIEDIIKNKLEKNKIFKEHKEIILNSQRHISGSGLLYKGYFEEGKWKQIFSVLNEVYEYIEENKDELKKGTSPLQDLIEKLISQRKVNIVDFYSNANVNKYLSEVSLDDIKNELTDYKDKNIEIE